MRIFDIIDSMYETKQQKRYSLYVLKLEQGKYYVGITSKKPEERFLEHKNGFYGAEWTRLYKPIKIDQVKDLGEVEYSKAEEYENKIARIYIKKYGLNNVRGGNITYRGNYVRRFGWLYHEESWETMVLVSLLTTMMLIFGLYTILDLSVGLN
jgi:predicted GIY-YIG superfamily endonuclease